MSIEVARKANPMEGAVCRLIKTQHKVRPAIVLVEELIQMALDAKFHPSG